MIWYISTRRCLKLISKQSSRSDIIICVSFDTNSQFVATGSYDNTSRLWNIETGKQIYQFKGNHHGIVSLQFNSSGDKLLTCSFDNARIFDVRTGNCIHILDQHTAKVRCAKFDIPGDYCATGSKDYKSMQNMGNQNWKIYNNFDRSYLWSNKFIFQYLREQIANNIGSKLVTISDDNTGRVYNVQTGEFITQLQGYIFGLNVQYLRLKNLIITECIDYCIKIYSEAGELLQLLGSPDQAIFCYSANYDGDILVTSLGYYGKLQIWKDVNK